MARLKRQDSSERRTAFVGFQVTPSERAGLEAAAARAGVTLSQLGRELCLRNAPQGVVFKRRDPERKALIGELTAIGNNLNQLCRLSHTHRSLPHFGELKETTDQLKATFARVMSSYDPPA